MSNWLKIAEISDQSEALNLNIRMFSNRHLMKAICTFFSLVDGCLCGKKIIENLVFTDLTFQILLQIRQAVQKNHI